MCSHIEIDKYLFTFLIISIIFVHISMYKKHIHIVACSCLHAWDNIYEPLPKGFQWYFPSGPPKFSRA